MTSRFSRGMSTPAMRAIGSALPLLVSGAGGADDHHPAVAADDLALLAHRLDARSYLHLDLALLVPVGDPTPGEVVRGDLHLHAVPRQDADAVHAHLPGAVRQHLVAVLQLDLEHGVG